MNLLALLHDELKDKHLNEIEIVRNIYLRCCEIFSFDSKLHYVYLFGKDYLKYEALEKEFDVENIDSFLVVCRSFSKYILKPSIEEFTSINPKLIGDIHTSLLLDYGNHKWELDATFGDLSRVKCKLRTNGFSCDDRHWDERIDEIDEVIGYKKYNKEYFNSRIKGDTVVDKMDSINKLLSTNLCKYHYSDASFFYSFLRELYLKNEQYSDGTYIDSNFNFNKLIKLQDDAYYNLKRKRSIYSINRISEEEYDHLSKTLVRAIKKKDTN